MTYIYGFNRFYRKIISLMVFRANKDFSIRNLHKPSKIILKKSVRLLKDK